MATRWSCPKSDCPPTEIAPLDVPESGESAGSESERPFTTDEVAVLLNVPLDTIYEWHEEGTGPPGYQMHIESHYRRSDVVRWLAEQGVTLAVCWSECGRSTREARSRRCRAHNPLWLRTPVPSRERVPGLQNTLA
jgi:excisionase family DNA binding protein